MAGYCIGLYKYMRIDENQAKKDKLMKTRKQISEDHVQPVENQHSKFLTFGEFDRIGFERVEKFSRFRDISIDGKEWVGDRQIHLIYEIPSMSESDCSAISYHDGNFYCNGEDGEVTSSHLFLGITVLQFKDSVRKTANEIGLEKLLQKYRKEILGYVGIDKDIKYEVFGTLGSFGLTIIWLADQYTKILDSVTKIRNYKISEDDGSISDYLSSYTILAQNHRREGDISWNEKVNNIEGDAILHLTLKKGIDNNVKSFLKRLCKDQDCVKHCVGEYDLVLTLPSKEVYRAFEKDGDLNFSSVFYTKYILQTNVQLCEITKLEDENNRSEDQKNSEVGNDSKKDLSSSTVLEELGEIQTEYKRLRMVFAKLYPSTVGMVDTLDLLYSDYISKISTASNEMWVNIFSYQFLNVLKTIKIICDSEKVKNISANQRLYIINDLLNDFSRQISHIAESNNLVLGTPICQFRYSGQNNLTLYAYFGYIKNILSEVYEKQYMSRQSEIIPFLVTDVIPIIKSRTYEYHMSMDNNNIGSIVTIRLPMVSLYNPIAYQPYLTHEIFHYVTPQRKYQRNQIFGCIYAIELLLSAFQMLAEKKIYVNDNDINTTNLNKEFWASFVMKYIFNFVVENYVNYIGINIESIDKNSIGYDELNDKVLGARMFGRNTTIQWVKWLNNEDDKGTSLNPIYLCMCYLVKNQEAIQGKEIRLMKQRHSDKDDLMSNLEEQIRLLFTRMDAIVNNNEKESKEKAYADLMDVWSEDVLDNANQIVSNIRESIADIEMVELNQMNGAEYLITLTKTKKEFSLDFTAQGFDLQDIIRIGIVLDYLQEKNNVDTLSLCSLDIYQNDFYDLYFGMYCSQQILENWNGQHQNLEEGAKMWFRYWQECYSSFQRQYGIYKKLLGELCSENLIHDCNDLKENLWKQYALSIRKFGNYIRNNAHLLSTEQKIEAYICFEKNVFNLNVDFIHTYYRQEDFSELNSKRRQTIEKRKSEEIRIDKTSVCNLKLESNLVPVKSTVKNIEPLEYRVNSVGQLGEYVSKIAYMLEHSCGRILGRRDYPIWYRGHESNKYTLIPSIMRKYKDAKSKSANKNFSLDSFLKQEFEEFKFRADGAPEAFERTSYTQADYLALMQHYFVPSNFLDWSEDAMSSLYFALEGFFDDKKTIPNEDAVLYMFSPALYNNARLRMIRRSEDEGRFGRKTTIDIDYVEDTIQNGIPNLTTDYNAEKYYMYLLGKKNLEKGYIPYIPDDNMREWLMDYYLPLAVYVSKLNRRISAQSGIFTAFHIYTSPDHENTFNYMAIEKIQQRYLRDFQNNDETCPFLYKIIIEKESRGKIAKWVKTFGMSKEKCYPELENIGKRIMQ